MWGVVEAPLRGGDFLREWFGVAEAAMVALVVRHCWQGILHDDVVFVRREPIMYSAGGF